MKAILPILLAFVAVGWYAAAQDAEVKGTPSPEKVVSESIQVQVLEYRLMPPNELKSGTVVYAGAVPQAIKLRNAFQLINPLAPMSVGGGELNVVRPMPGDNAFGIAVVRVSR